MCPKQGLNNFALWTSGFAVAFFQNPSADGFGPPAKAVELLAVLELEHLEADSISYTTATWNHQMTGTLSRISKWFVYTWNKLLLQSCSIRRYTYIYIYTIPFLRDKYNDRSLRASCSDSRTCHLAEIHVNVQTPFWTSWGLGGSVLVPQQFHHTSSARNWYWIRGYSWSLRWWHSVHGKWHSIF